MSLKAKIFVMTTVCISIIFCVTGCTAKKQVEAEPVSLKWKINFIDHRMEDATLVDEIEEETSEETLEKSAGVIKGYTDNDTTEEEEEAPDEVAEDETEEPEPEQPVETVTEEPVVQEPVQQQPTSVADQMAVRPGMIGRFSIPSVGIDVAVFDSDSQAVADAADSACSFSWLGYEVFGDHQNQGWSVLAYCVPGSTLAYFDNGASVTTYVCTANFTGFNDGTQFYDDAGNVLTGANLVTYTCIGLDWTHDRFCYWEVA